MNGFQKQGLGFLAVLVVATLLLGCAHLSTKDEFANWYPKVPLFGAFFAKTEGGIEVLQVADGTPASKAGIKPGDIIEDFNGIKFNKPVELVRYIQSLPVGAKVSLTINRNDVKITKTATLNKKRAKIPNILLTIQELLDDKQKVSVAIVVININNTCHGVTEEWKNAAKNALVASMESTLLRDFGREENFSLVDSRKVKTTLKRTKPIETLLSYRTNGMQELGATHFILIEASRSCSQDFWGNWKFTDVECYKLISGETGKILSIARVTSIIDNNGKLIKATVH